MKTLNAIGALAVAVYAVLALGACSKTSNDSATTPATCTMTANGTMVDQYGRYCNSTSLQYCQGYTYVNGQYINPANGQPVNCGNTNVIPSTGYYGNQYVGGGTTGCELWSQLYYPNVYVPVNVGGGSIMCVNWQYLQGYAQQAYYYTGNYNYMDPNYYYSYPMSAYQYGYTGYGYGYCQQNVSLGFTTGDGGTNFGVGANLCFQ